jgi:hypothetical protein
MIVESVKDEYGDFITPMPYLIEQKDIDSLINQSENDDKAAIKAALIEHIGIRLGNLTRTNGIGFKEPHGNADLPLVRKVNSIIEILNIRITQMREAYFNNRRDGDIGARYDFETKHFCLYNTQNCAPSPKEPESATTKHSDSKSKNITDYKALISTRKLLKTIGGNLYYNGPVFKFASNSHQSPADAYLSTLAKQYMMQVIIPNVLLAKKFGWITIGKAAMSALDYCMTTGKCQRAKDSWERLKSDDKMMTPIKDIYNFYAANTKRDKQPIEKDRQWYFDKFVNLKCKENTTKFRRGKTQDAVDDLLARMENEPELKTASHRKLMEKGVSNQAARHFMKARKVQKGVANGKEKHTQN